MIRKKPKDFNYCAGKKYDGMMGRCYRPNDASFKNYGHRGIRVCLDWVTDINKFKEWLLAELVSCQIPMETFVANSSKFQLDRIDVNGHYSPNNCRIVNSQTNARNTTKRKKREYETAEGIVVFF